MRENRTSGSMRRGGRRVMVHSANGHRTRKGGNGGAPPDLFTTALRVNRLFAITIPTMTAILYPVAANAEQALARPPRPNERRRMISARRASFDFWSAPARTT